MPARESPLHLRRRSEEGLAPPAYGLPFLIVPGGVFRQCQVSAVAPNRGQPLRPTGYPGRCTIEPAGTRPPALLYVMGPLRKAGLDGIGEYLAQPIK